MQIVFSEVIFMDKYQETFDRPDGCAKGWILPDADSPVAKRWHQGGGVSWYELQVSTKLLLGHSKSREFTSFVYFGHFSLVLCLLISIFDSDLVGHSRNLF